MRSVQQVWVEPGRPAASCILCFAPLGILKCTVSAALPPAQARRQLEEEVARYRAAHAGSELASPGTRHGHHGHSHGHGSAAAGPGTPSPRAAAASTAAVSEELASARDRIAALEQQLADVQSDAESAVRQLRQEGDQLRQEAAALRHQAAACTAAADHAQQQAALQGQYAGEVKAQNELLVSQLKAERGTRDKQDERLAQVGGRRGVQWEKHSGLCFVCRLYKIATTPIPVGIGLCWSLNACDHVLQEHMFLSFPCFHLPPVTGHAYCT